MTDTNIRKAGSLDAADLGTPLRIEWEGWVHTGALGFVKHELRTWSGTTVTFLCLRAESGSRWMEHLPSGHPVEIRKEP